MSDDSAKAEEERIQRAMNRKARSSMVVKPTQIEHSAPTPSFSQKPKSTAPEKPKPVADKPKPAPATSQSQSVGNRSAEIESLQLKKRTILGTIATTRRDLDEVRAEIAKLKNKEAELVSLLEKREQSVHQLTQEVEELEKKEREQVADVQKHKDEEKARRQREEIERRRQEDVEEERRRLEQEEKKLLNPQPVYSPRSYEEEADVDGLNAEEQRIMRAMSRPGKGGAVGAGRVSNIKPAAAAPAKPAMSEAEKQRIAEENKKKEEEQRIQQEKDLQQRIAHLQVPGGVKKTFISAQVYDFDADVKFLSDFTHFEEIPITTPMDNNFTFSVSWTVSPGPHFYLFKINGKAEINKNLPTGLAPNGLLMNKVDC
jgi:myosin heavy subunit